MSSAGPIPARVPPITASGGETWEVACSQTEVQAPLEQFLEVTNLLLEQVQLNSTHLFRADILTDTSSNLATLAEKEARCRSTVGTDEAKACVEADKDEAASTANISPPTIEGFELHRTVVRRLIPRKPQLDKPLEQSCFIYHNTASDPDSTKKQALVVYYPYCTSSDAMPWYHPKVQGLAYLYANPSTVEATRIPSVTLSIHYLPFPDTPSPLPDRLTRTFQSLLKTMIRLLKLPSKTKSPAQHPSDSRHPNGNTDSTTPTISTISLTPSSLKDTILPQHTVQNTYTRLKQAYAADLISRWIEKTEPSKHVFEDISIAAFLIELWGSMYGSQSTFNSVASFVDIACGNGVLVYVLISEGWRGWGFDARRRKTWDVLGPEVAACLHEKLCIPRPFSHCVAGGEFTGLDTHDGTFGPGTFIISNHADELTCWTPILAALSDGERPLPFLAIPCCSHALDGSRRRYTLKEVAESLRGTDGVGETGGGEEKEAEEVTQPAAGDLKAMRAAKQKANAHGDDKSMYACLTRKTAALAQELGMDVELTLMRIPSTRNIGIVGNRKEAYKVENDKKQLNTGMHGLSLADDTGKTAEKVQNLLDREFARSGGVDNAGRTWIDKAKKLHGGQGRGKVNLNGPIK